MRGGIMASFDVAKDKRADEKWRWLIYDVYGVLPEKKNKADKKIKKTETEKQEAIKNGFGGIGSPS
jgi:hypothetical protein